MPPTCPAHVVSGKVSGENPVDRRRRHAQKSRGPRSLSVLNNGFHYAILDFCHLMRSLLDPCRLDSDNNSAYKSERCNSFCRFHSTAAANFNVRSLRCILADLSLPSYWTRRPCNRRSAVPDTHCSKPSVC